MASAKQEEVKVYPFYIANKPVTPNQAIEVLNKYTQEVGARVARASPEDIDKAIGHAVEATEAMADLPAFTRQAILERVVEEVTARKEEFARALCMEAGKAITDARGEVQRLIDTFKIAAGEAVRLSGEYLPIDYGPRGKGFQSIVRRFPIGPVSMVSPWNFPLNLVAHKVAPAIAAGCPFVLKPASRTPIGALLLGEILSKIEELPPGAFSILPCERDGADLFTTDDRLKLLTFTGSASVGWRMKERAGKKKVVLELGGNAACIVEDLVPDLDGVVARLWYAGFYQSGQSCISMQRLYIHERHYEGVKAKLVEETRKLKKGDPFDEDTKIGPIISEKEAIRMEEWVKKAVDAGAKVLVGGKRDGVLFDATILEGVPPDQEVVCEEIFGPILVISKYADFKDAVKQANDSRYGLQAGVFTSDLNKAFYAYEKLQVGGVVINDGPSTRFDNQPYGGLKDSGIEREGVKYAIEHMTEPKIMLMRNLGKL
jgi:acyl-CoA reductase-like NAD-dependent aldehyde dehydrogenase